MNSDLQISQFGLTDEEINRITSIFVKYPSIEKAIIYGSRTKGNYRQYPDIDLALMEVNLNLTTQNLIEADLDDLLLPFTFDLSILAKIENPGLLDHITRVGKIFYSLSERCR